MENSIITPKLILLPESIKLSDVPDDIYFSNEYSSYISNSKLGLINPKQGGSAEKYKEGFKNSFNDSFVLGSAIHQLILQPNDFYLVEELDRPTAKMGYIADIIYKNYKEGFDFESAVKSGIIEGNYYGGKLTDNNINKVSEKCQEYVKNRDSFKPIDGKEPIFLDARSREIVKNCISKFHNNPTLTNTISPKCLFHSDIRNEECVTADIIVQIGNKEVPLKFKGKVDNYTLVDDLELQINDLKSTGRSVEEFVNHSFYNYHYYRQMAIYNWLLINYYKQRIPNIVVKDSAMLLISTIPPHTSGIYTVTSDDIQKGLFEFKELMTRVALCELFGYSTDVLNSYIKGELNQELLL